MLYRFKTLLLNKKHIYISLALIMFLLMPLIVFIGKLGGFLWYEDIQVFSVLYQFIFVLLSGTAFVFFFQDIVEEKGREIFFVAKRMYLKEAVLFLLLDESILFVSLIIAGEASEIYKEGVLFVSVANLLVLGIMYCVQFFSSSATLAIGTLILLMIQAGMYISDICIMVYWSENYRDMLSKTVYLLGLAICAWALGGLANLFYVKYD